MKQALIAALAGLALAGAAEAQAGYSPPRGADGHPDFGGVWSMKFLGFLQRSQKVATLIVPPEQEADVVKHIKLGGKVNDPDFASYNLENLPRVKGTIRSSFLVEPADGRVPFSPKAIALNDEADKFFEMYDNPEERDSSERCVSGLIQAPVRPIPMYMPVLFVQTPDAIAMQTEDVVGSRIIHMSGARPPAGVTSRDGWSGGRWDGDTLVVETTNFSPAAPFISQIGPSLIVGPASRIVERFERVSKDELFYAYTIEDPALYTKPWRAEFSFARDDGASVYEYACHEANYALVNALKGGRANDGKKPAK